MQLEHFLAGKTETKLLAAVIQVIPVAGRCSDEPCPSVPRATAHYPISRRLRILPPILCVVGIRFVQCRCPFPHIASHIQHPIRADPQRILPNRYCILRPYTGFISIIRLLTIRLCITPGIHPPIFATSSFLPGSG